MLSQFGEHCSLCTAQAPLALNGGQHQLLRLGQALRRPPARPAPENEISHAIVAELADVHEVIVGELEPFANRRFGRGFAVAQDVVARAVVPFLTSLHRLDDIHEKNSAHRSVSFFKAPI